MSITKRCLFLYISISSGHQRAAEAVMSALRELNPKIETQGVDSFSLAFPVVGRLVARMYLEMIEHTPLIWSYLYDNPTVEEATREIRQLLNVFNTKKIYKLLKRHRPRCLVCTQAVPAMILSSMKQKGKIRIPLVGIVTDFGVHSYWLSKSMDLYLVGTEEIKKEMIRRGIRENRIHVTGIPVDPHFTTRGNKTSERLRLGLHPNVPTALIMGGSKGLGPVEDMVESLRKIPSPLQILVVCGQNRSTQKKLQKRFGGDNNVRLFGFTKNVSRLMDASDILISKPGGMTCAESLAKGLPLIMIRPIPGQEERNARYLLKHNAAERVDSIGDLPVLVQRLLQQKDRLRRLQENASALARPYAAYEAAEIILRFMKEPITSYPRGAADSGSSISSHERDSISRSLTV